MEWVACVGIDWAEEEHAFAIHERADVGVSSRGTIGSSAEQVHEWIRQLRARFPSGTIVVAVEQGRSSLLYALMMYDFLALVPINPRASKAYRDSLRLSGASSDRVDAGLICEFAVKHLSALRVWEPDDAATRKLRLFVEARRNLVDQRTALTHSLAAALKNYFPQALEWFGGESSPLLWAVVTRWPTLERLQRASVEQITHLLRSHRRHHAVKIATELVVKIASATPLTSDRAIVEASTLYAQALIAMLTPLDEQIAKHDQVIAAHWAEHPDRVIFDSLPGAGRVLAPRLAAVFGRDRSRFATANELQCYSGIAPVIEASGQQRWVHARYAYPRFVRQTFHEFAQASIPHCKWAHAFYREQRRRGAGHHEAIRALAFRWIRILVRLWKTGAAYDEQRYLDTLRAKGSPFVTERAA